MAAHQSGKIKSDCPYASDNPKHEEWMKVFDAMVLSYE
jgi:hypothetical protein